MIAESCNEECLVKLERELRTLFFAGGTISLTPQQRYDHANMIIAQAEEHLNSRSKYPELHALFVKLEASCERACERRTAFEERNQNLTKRAE